MFDGPRSVEAATGVHRRLISHPRKTPTPTAMPRAFAGSVEVKSFTHSSARRQLLSSGRREIERLFLEGLGPRTDAGGHVVNLVDHGGLSFPRFNRGLSDSPLTAGRRAGMSLARRRDGPPSAAERSGRRRAGQ